MKLIDWVKNNKLVVFLLLVVCYLVFNSVVGFFGISRLSLDKNNEFGGYNDLVSSSAKLGPLSGTGPLSATTYERDYTPQTDVQERFVIQQSSLSLLVEDVVMTREEILDKTRQVGGYMVNVKTSNPQDAPTATITLRIPSNMLDETLEVFRKLSIKVVSENLVGKDVTDQYVDIEERLQALEKTKARFESLLEQAEEIQDITKITEQVLNYQRQIDSLKGQRQSLDQNAKLAKLTIYLSTDEIALPYTPNETFRPNVILKLAVRSMIGHLRTLAALAIWVVVYSIIWVPALTIFVAVKKWRSNKRPSKS